MESIHNSSHFGINRTLDLVSSKYYWPGLANDVKQYVSTKCTNTTYLACVCTCMCHVHVLKLIIISFQVRSCDICQRNNHKLQKAPGSLRPIPVPSKLWSQVGMDLIGPLPQTSRGNQYIVTLTDYFTKWAEAAPLLDKSAVGVARFIYSVSFQYFMWK